MNDRSFSFVGGAVGQWAVSRLETVVGETLPHVERLFAINGAPRAYPEASWVLRGVVSNERYTSHREKDRLAAAQPPIGRPEATCGALIPIRKSPEWWALPQDDRRAIFEERSHHIELGLAHLPAVARRLHHCRELGEPFDFLTWFEFPPTAASSFESLVAQLRQSEEWRYVDREIDIRVQRAATA